MPLYEYECQACGHRFEQIRKFSDPPVTVCPKCGGEVDKLMSSPAVQFKGTGWYVTDYARKDTKDTKDAKDAKDAKDTKEGSGSDSTTKDTKSTKESSGSDSTPKDTKSTKEGSGSDAATSTKDTKDTKAT